MATTSCGGAAGTGGPIATDASAGGDVAMLWLPDSAADEGAQTAGSADAAMTDGASPHDAASSGDGADPADGAALVDAIGDGFFDPPDSADSAAGGNDVVIGQTAPPWLLSIDNGSRQLLKVDIVSGKTAAICTIQNKFSYPSLTFRRDNVLVASRKGAGLDQINPCTCEVVTIGPYGAATGVNGITSNHAQGLFGISAGLQTLIAINPASGVATSIGALGVKFGANGATWSDAIGALYAINANDDTLYVVDPKTGVASPQAILSKKFSTVGVERHPGNGQIYACTDDGILRKVDPVTGNVSEIGPMGQASACTNLAAPWGPVACIDNVAIP